MGLLDIRDALAEAKDLVGCLYLACQGLQSGEERRALSALSHNVREKLALIDEAAQEVIGSVDFQAEAE